MSLRMKISILAHFLEDKQSRTRLLEQEQYDELVAYFRMHSSSHFLSSDLFPVKSTAEREKYMAALESQARKRFRERTKNFTLGLDKSTLYKVCRFISILILIFS